MEFSYASKYFFVGGLDQEELCRLRDFYLFLFSLQVHGEDKSREYSQDQQTFLPHCALGEFFLCVLLFCCCVFLNLPQA